LKASISNTHQEFAQKMIDDHGRANQKLTDIARKKGWTLPTSMTAQQQRDLDELARLSGPDFERRYHDMQVKAHDEAIELFTEASSDCDDADLKRFASDTLPTLREHRRHLEEHPF
jgi:putative membrane protein